MQEIHSLHLVTSELFPHAGIKDLEGDGVRKSASLVVWEEGHPGGLGFFVTPLPGPAGAVRQHFIHPRTAASKAEPMSRQ